MDSFVSIGDRIMSILHFERKAMPVIPEHRPMYKICQVLLTLNISSTGGKSSLIRLHLFNWALKDKTREKMLISSSKSGVISFGVWGIDPVLNMAINFGVAEDLISTVSTGFQITKSGKDFLTNGNIQALFKDDAETLTLIGKSITEKMVKDVARRWKDEV